MQTHLSYIRTQKIWVGSLSLLGSTGVTIVVGIFMAGILARYFSSEEFGLWSILMSLNGILVNGFDLGFGNALRNRLAQLYSNPDLARKEGPGYFFSIFFWFILSAAILTGLFFTLKPRVPWGLLFRSENSELVNQGASLLILGASILAFNIAFNLYTSGFFGYQETHWNALLNGFSKLSLLCFLAALVILQRSFFFINLMFFLLTLAASMVSFFIFLNRRKWPLQIPALASIWAKVKELWGKSAQFALLQGPWTGDGGGILPGETDLLGSGQFSFCSPPANLVSLYGIGGIEGLRLGRKNGTQNSRLYYNNFLSGNRLHAFGRKLGRLSLDG